MTFDSTASSAQAWCARYADLADKTVFVSGGASGIGASLVAAFAEQGAQVWFVDINDDAGETLAARLSETAPLAPVFSRCDVTDIAAYQAVIDAAATETGRLDVMINNAGHDDRHDVETVDSAYWDRCVAINLKHQFFGAQRAFHWMKPRGAGAVVNFGSIAPRLAVADLAVYNAMKSGVIGMTRTLSRTFGAYGVRVNAIMPGAILTPRQRALWVSSDDEVQIAADQHLHRRLVGDDVAPAALFLASEASNAITSQAIVVDAGHSPSFL